MDVDITTMTLRILLAAGLGLVVGLERERHGRAAGLRTCMLVAMAGALLMSLSLHLAQLFAAQAADSVVRLDPGRLPSYAIAGMGFLGAGAIIQGRRSARGVTTGAAMWLCTGIGLSVGAGLYLPALVTVALAIIALWCLRIPAQALRSYQFVRLEVEAHSPSVYNEVRDLLDSYRATTNFVGRQRCLETDEVTFSFSLVVRGGKKWKQFLADLDQVDGVKCYTWQEGDVP